MLSTEQSHLIRNSFKLVRRHGEVTALLFYQKLFEMDPSLQRLFTTDIKAQARKLMEMLASAVGLLDEPEQLVSALEALGSRHTGYGVRKEHYDTVGRALISTLETVLKEKFTPEVRSAWLTLYGVIASTMLQGAAKTAKQTGEA